jgi:gas vesicle protein
MFEKKTSFAKFAFTFGFGIVAGTVIGLLYAPMTGKKLQKKVADVTEKVFDRVEDFQAQVKKVANA